MTARRLAVRIFAGVLLVVAVVVGAILLSLNRSDKAATTSEVNKGGIMRNRARIATNEHKDDATRRCLTVAKHPQACVDRVVGAQGPGGAQGRGGTAGKAGARGLSAVGKPGPRGPAGKNGQDAPAPTAERIAEGFAIWCLHVPCVGANGTNGTDGKDAPPVTPEDLRIALRDLCGGSCNGTNGMDAPPPTQEQVNAGVAAVCMSGGCPAPPGPQGPQGEPGPPGAPGSLVLSVQTCLPGQAATDPDGDGNFTCP